MTYEESLRANYDEVRARLYARAVPQEPQRERAKPVRVPLARFSGEPIPKPAAPLPLPVAREKTPPQPTSAEMAKMQAHLTYAERKEANRRRYKERKRERSFNGGKAIRIEPRSRLPNPFNQPWQEIVNEVAEETGVMASDIIGRSRFREHVAARGMALRRIRAEVIYNGEPPSTTTLAIWFKRDHTSILYYLGRLTNRQHRRRTDDHAAT